MSTFKEALKAGIDELDDDSPVLKNCAKVLWHVEGGAPVTEAAPPAVASRRKRRNSSDHDPEFYKVCRVGVTNHGYHGIAVDKLHAELRENGLISPNHTVEMVETQLRRAGTILVKLPNGNWVHKKFRRNGPQPSQGQAPSREV